MIQLPCMQIMTLLNSSKEVVSLMMLFFVADSGETRNNNIIRSPLHVFSTPAMHCNNYFNLQHDIQRDVTI